MHHVPTGPGTPDATPQRYDIRVTGHLADRWGAVLGGMTLTTQDDGTTVLHGPLADQSALHGLLRKLNDLGLPLVSVTTAPVTTTPLIATPVTTTPVTPHESQRNPQPIDRSLDARPTGSTP